MLKAQLAHLTAKLGYRAPQQTLLQCRRELLPGLETKADVAASGFLSDIRPSSVHFRFDKVEVDRNGARVAQLRGNRDPFTAGQPGTGCRQLLPDPVMRSRLKSAESDSTW